MIIAYYLTFKENKQIDQLDQEDLESFEFGVNEDYLKLGKWSIVYFRIF